MNKTVNRVIEFKNAQSGPDLQPTPPASSSTGRKSGTNQYSHATALRMFYRLEAGLWKVQRITGVAIGEIEHELRQLGRAEFERRYGRKAA